MKSWNRPEVPQLPGEGSSPLIWDTASARLVEARPDGGTASIYVCGITPYDATHIGHAATYLTYDTLIRAWLDAGHTVRYVQNTTDVDDPLLERAAATGVDWRVLADEQTELFRHDMESMRIIPPDHYAAVTELIEPVADAVKSLLDRGVAYCLEGDPHGDVYFDNERAAAVAPWRLGDNSRLDHETMMTLSAERGGDPERPGKRDPLDPLLWRGARPGEPSWPSVLGEGRPGWHIECSVIAQQFLELPLTVKGGGSDLIFPHHEFSAGHSAALTGKPLAHRYCHAGLVGYRGEKMSKSVGNLVLVSSLTASGVDPRAVRLALLAQHYRRDWEWTDQLLADAMERLSTWQSWAGGAAPAALECTLVEQLRAAISRDLDTPSALSAVDRWIASGAAATTDDIAAIDALLGIRLVAPAIG